MRSVRDREDRNCWYQDDGRRRSRSSGIAKPGVGRSFGKITQIIVSRATR